MGRLFAIPCRINRGLSMADEAVPGSHVPGADAMASEAKASGADASGATACASAQAVLL